MAAAAWQLPGLLPGVGGGGVQLLGQTARGRVQVKHQREDRLAGHVKELDLATLQVLPGIERVDLVRPGPMVVVRVLHVHLAVWLAGEDVRLAAGEPDVAVWAGGLGWDLVILQAQGVESLNALNLLTWPCSQREREREDCQGHNKNSAR